MASPINRGPSLPPLSEPSINVPLVAQQVQIDIRSLIEQFTTLLQTPSKFSDPQLLSEVANTVKSSSSFIKNNLQMES